jgi:hypothetical protein
LATPFCIVKGGPGVIADVFAGIPHCTNQTSLKHREIFRCKAKNHAAVQYEALSEKWNAACTFRSGGAQF